ncbi:hypothetical protein MKW98_027304 [Papaver atlanticum]|uniref:BURP domain-containing protein n=1 Tax=Papaver atlanticum TaxID=357466 RepID=A0AAD4SRI8_9MAGN|nr:hypothetical protein MKW98_027304 [Papaver atlanticum]
MELLLVLISASCLLVAAVGNHAALPSEIYWINKLPNTPMPIILHDLLHPDQEGKSLTDVRAAGPSPGSRYTPKHRNTIDQEGKPLTDKVGSSFRNNEATFLNGAIAAIPTVRYSPKHRNNIQNQLNLQKYSKNPPLGKNRVDNGQLQYNPGASLFFLEKDLHPGAKMNLQFVASTASGTTFLPQKLAKVTPFSSDKLPEILIKFAINSKSEEAELINETINSKSEEKSHTAQAYVVPLVGVDEMKIKATVVCHKDTSEWDPDHVAFQVLKVKPGTVPICHFLTEDTIIWVAKNKDN